MNSSVTFPYGWEENEALGGGNETMGGGSIRRGMSDKLVVGDYLLVVYLSGCVLIGGPINLYVYGVLFSRWKRTPSPSLIFKLQLNISDLLVLFIFAFPKIIHHLTFYWLIILMLGGNWMCKIVKFGSELSFQFSSAILACIGIDRLLSVIKPFTAYDVSMTRLKYMSSIAWIYSTVFSAPQFYRFHTCRISEMGGEQCTTYRCPSTAALMSFDYTGAQPSNITLQVQAVEERRQELNMIINEWLAVAHMLTIFWLPLSIMLLSYLIILRHIWSHYHPTTGVYLTTSTPTTAAQQTTIPTSLSLDGYKRDQKYTYSESAREMPLLQIHHRSAITVPSRTLRTTLILITAYVMFWLPYHMSALWLYYNPASSNHHYSLVRAFSNLIVFNSVVNPFIYFGGDFLPKNWRQNLGKGCIPRRQNKAANLSSTVRLDPSRNQHIPISSYTKIPISSYSKIPCPNK